MPRDGNAVVQLADAASHAQLRVELFGIPTSRPAPSANLSSASFSGMNVQWQVFGEHVQQTMVLNSRPAGDRVPFTIWQRATLAASDGAGGALLHAIGSAATWGGNWDGELGNGNTTNQSSPVQVQGLSGVTAIAAGRFFSLAVKSDGTVWAWGDNESGQLGNGTNPNSLTPVQVQGFTGVSQLKAGEYFVLALKPDGSVWGWGDNPFGQLGLGTNSGGLNTPQHITTLTGVSLIGTGGYHSLAEKTDGTL
ncbi:MAG: RCC1 repeat-containing protein, partial [Acidobacteria bacterium]|nr:RCC1 repeat-containing protein [Acidobacteriota bacterium]